MIDKDKIKEQNIQMIDTAESINPLFEYLKKNFPQVIDSDNQVSLKTIASLLGVNNSSNIQGYELTFAGKGLANALYSTPISKELRLEPNQSKIAPPPPESKCKENIDTRNTIIRGDNLDVLKLLKSAYSDKIKMIYIDPPYNTKNENFIYPDNFREDYKKILIETGLLGFDEEGEEIPSDTLKFFRNIIGTRSHTGWLSFMLPRLKLARDLLREDGVIFISIDDNEQANLKLLCDEIFGEENFVYLLSVVNKLNGNDNSSGMMETQEYCLIYAKDSNLFQMGVLNISEDSNKDWQEDEKGWWKEGGSLKATGENAPREKRPNLFFPIYIDEENLNFSLEQDVNHNYELLPITDDREMSWYWEKEKFKKEANEVIIKKTKNGYSLYKKQRPSLGDMPSKRGKTTFYSPKYSTANSNVEIKNLFNGNGVFNYTKSKDLIKDFISLSNARNDIILDFFAGSGTTAQAVMELNAEDGGNREFILVQIDQQINEDKNKTAYDFCKNELGSQAPVISDITIERINRAGEKIKETFKQDLTKNTQNLDIGYRVYTLSDKPSIISDESGALRLVSSRDGLSSYDIARSLALSSGKILSLPLEEIIKDKLYFCQDSYYLVGIDDEVMDKLGAIKDFEIYIDGYSDIDLQNLLNLNVANKEQIIVIY